MAWARTFSWIAGALLLGALFTGLFAMHGIQATPSPATKVSVLGYHGPGHEARSDAVSPGRSSAAPPAHGTPVTAPVSGASPYGLSAGAPVGAGAAAVPYGVSADGVSADGLPYGGHGEHSRHSNGHPGGMICLAVLVLALVLLLPSRTGLVSAARAAPPGLATAGGRVRPRGPNLLQLSVLRL
ncbi:hypothetical protein [Bailinhaonella thermotolerans]|uniref:Uncharacterized protein n=1 Tax=Bailinhaonella thermotolerans TaxID=1070861 RepID=A0A3A4BN38_9ACTN|nr:hypothetical protein [Bailinhaonella thermotolerans]RJL32484.1 hypothetical protein D5H75_13190 [Bailinhaonella thermotolerans]